MTTDFETLVIGAGVVGLATAAEFARRGHNVLVIERHERSGSETSSRNSGVIHAGLYYPPGSKRARFCVEGKQRLYDFCAANGVPHKRIGKLILATRDEDNERLDAIAKNASASGVHDIERLSADEAKAMEPDLHCTAALRSPSTGIVDAHAVMDALEGHITNHGGEIIFMTRVTGLKKTPAGYFEITTQSTVPSESPADAVPPPTTITARNVVMSAGLGATQLANLIHTPTAQASTTRPTYTPPQTGYAKGHYYTLSARSPFSTLIYPVPAETGLGIHLTLELDGRAKFGPDVSWIDTIDYAFDADTGNERLHKFETSVRTYWPGLPDDALHPDTTGIRPRIFKQGEPHADFQVHGPGEHGVENLIGLYGIESPGLTSAMAIAPFVAGLLSKNR